MTTLESDITFGAERIDRAAHLRSEASGLLTHPDARTLAIWRGKPLMRLSPGPTLAWLPTDAAALAVARDAPVFLGLEDGAPRFSHDVSAWEDPEADAAGMAEFVDRTANAWPGLPEDHAFSDLRALMAELSPDDAGDAAMAKAVLGWHETHPFCARCGTRTEPAQGGWQRDCPSCGTHHFPRTDPVVIVLATRGDRVLLGRSPGWPEGMYSLLAGFVEPGETVEAACRREVFEEAGIRLGAVRILASQPWPFPASLMMGCAAEALGTDITVDPAEIEDARWVTRQEVMESFAGLSPWLRAARKGAIARTLLEAWAAGKV
ncbi:NAD(+) diphosphatase [Paroceanicella profunda]|uniref:NAD(+) diphosphatase n=1 Tax=Paroceanicella profunda TaxID=2579971 RepID=A0A5B8G084_9RHOB|nr:NAD(+) diphosphatase [Paroceanicella profunda]QDL92449.1 NAD(+) diphosphatase [Paroceanicella profunda]